MSEQLEVDGAVTWMMGGKIRRDGRRGRRRAAALMWDEGRP